MANIAGRAHALAKKHVGEPLVQAKEYVKRNLKEAKGAYSEARKAEAEKDDKPKIDEVEGKGVPKKTLKDAERVIEKDMKMAEVHMEAAKDSKDELSTKAKKIEAAKLLNDADKIKEDLAAFAAAELPKGSGIKAFIVRDQFKMPPGILDTSVGKEWLVDCKNKPKTSRCKAILHKLAEKAAEFKETEKEMTK